MWPPLGLLFAAALASAAGLPCDSLPKDTKGLRLDLRYFEATDYFSEEGFYLVARTGTEHKAEFCFLFDAQLMMSVARQGRTVRLYSNVDSRCGEGNFTDTFPKRIPKKMVKVKHTEAMLIPLESALHPDQLDGLTKSHWTSLSFWASLVGKEASSEGADETNGKALRLEAQLWDGAFGGRVRARLPDEVVHVALHRPDPSSVYLTSNSSSNHTLRLYCKLAGKKWSSSHSHERPVNQTEHRIFLSEIEDEANYGKELHIRAEYRVLESENYRPFHRLFVVTLERPAEVTDEPETATAGPLTASPAVQESLEAECVGTGLGPVLRWRTLPQHAGLTLFHRVDLQPLASAADRATELGDPQRFLCPPALRRGVGELCWNPWSGDGVDPFSVYAARVSYMLLNGAWVSDARIVPFCWDCLSCQALLPKSAPRGGPQLGFAPPTASELLRATRNLGPSSAQPSPSLSADPETLGVSIRRLGSKGVFLVASPKASDAGQVANVLLRLKPEPKHGPEQPWKKVRGPVTKFGCPAGLASSSRDFCFPLREVAGGVPHSLDVAYETAAGAEVAAPTVKLTLPASRPSPQGSPGLSRSARFVDPATWASAFAPPSGFQQSSAWSPPLSQSRSGFGAQTQQYHTSRQVFRSPVQQGLLSGFQQQNGWMSPQGHHVSQRVLPPSISPPSAWHTPDIGSSGLSDPFSGFAAPQLSAQPAPLPAAQLRQPKVASASTEDSGWTGRLRAFQSPARVIHRDADWSGLSTGRQRRALEQPSQPTSSRGQPSGCRVAHRERDLTWELAEPRAAAEEFVLSYSSEGLTAAQSRLSAAEAAASCAHPAPGRFCARVPDSLRPGPTYRLTIGALSHGLYHACSRLAFRLSQTPAPDLASGFPDQSFPSLNQSGLLSRPARNTLLGQGSCSPSGRLCLHYQASAPFLLFRPPPQLSLHRVEVFVTADGLQKLRRILSPVLMGCPVGLGGVGSLCLSVGALPAGVFLTAAVRYHTVHGPVVDEPDTLRFALNQPFQQGGWGGQTQQGFVGGYGQAGYQQNFYGQGYGQKQSYAKPSGQGFGSNSAYQLGRPGGPGWGGSASMALPGFSYGWNPLLNSPELSIDPLRVYAAFSNPAFLQRFQAAQQRQLWQHQRQLLGPQKSGGSRKSARSSAWAPPAPSFAVASGGGGLGGSRGETGAEYSENPLAPPGWAPPPPPRGEEKGPRQPLVVPLDAQSGDHTGRLVSLSDGGYVVAWSSPSGSLALARSVVLSYRRSSVAGERGMDVSGPAQRFRLACPPGRRGLCWEPRQLAPGTEYLLRLDYQLHNGAWVRQSHDTRVTIPWGTRAPLPAVHSPDYSLLTASVVSTDGRQTLVWLLPESYARDVAQFSIRYTTLHQDGTKSGRPGDFSCPEGVRIPPPAGYAEFCWSLRGFAPGSYRISVFGESGSGQPPLSSAPITFAVFAPPPPHSVRLTNTSVAISEGQGRLPPQPPATTQPPVLPPPVLDHVLYGKHVLHWKLSPAPASAADIRFTLRYRSKVAGVDEEVSLLGSAAVCPWALDRRRDVAEFCFTIPDEHIDHGFYLAEVSYKAAGRRLASNTASWTVTVSRSTATSQIPVITVAAGGGSEGGEEGEGGLEWTETEEEESRRLGAAVFERYVRIGGRVDGRIEVLNGRVFAIWSLRRRHLKNSLRFVITYRTDRDERNRTSRGPPADFPCPAQVTSRIASTPADVEVFCWEFPDAIVTRTPNQPLPVTKVRATIRVEELRGKRSESGLPSAPTLPTPEPALIPSPVLLRHEASLASLVWTTPQGFQLPRVWELRYGLPGRPETERIDSRGVAKFPCPAALPSSPRTKHFCWALPPGLAPTRYAALVTGGPGEEWLRSNSVVWQQSGRPAGLRRRQRNLQPLRPHLRQQTAELPLSELRFLVNGSYSPLQTPHFGPPLGLAEGHCAALRFLITDPAWRLQSRLCRWKNRGDCVEATHAYATHKKDRWQCHEWAVKGGGKWRPELMASPTGRPPHQREAKLAVFLLPPGPCGRLC